MTDGMAAELINTHHRVYLMERRSRAKLERLLTNNWAT